MGLQDFAASLGDNPYFGAGAGLFGIGLLTQAARRGAVVLQTVLRRKYVLTMEVPSTDKSYDWLLNWITTRGARNTQHLSVQTQFEKSDATGKVSTRFDFIPSPGAHVIWYKNRFVYVLRERENKMVNFETGTPWENVTLSTLGSSRQLFVDMLLEAREFALQGTEGLTRIYKPEGQPPEWRPFGQPARPRRLESVVLDEGVAQKLVDDVKDFIANALWYQDRGIPYRRGYLLHGPPGCGKSSFITALAGELQHSICLLNLSLARLDFKILSFLDSLPRFPRCFHQRMRRNYSTWSIFENQQEGSASLSFETPTAATKSKSKIRDSTMASRHKAETTMTVQTFPIEKWSEDKAERMREKRDEFVQCMEHLDFLQTHRCEINSDIPIDLKTRIAQEVVEIVRFTAEEYREKLGKDHPMAIDAMATYFAMRIHVGNEIKLLHHAED